MYSPNRNPTELYYERQALLMQEARNKRLARGTLTALSTTMLVVFVAFVGLATIVVRPGRVIDYVGTHLLLGVWIIGVLAVLVGLLMLEGGKCLDDERSPTTDSFGPS